MKDIRILKLCTVHPEMRFLLAVGKYCEGIALGVETMLIYSTSSPTKLPTHFTCYCAYPFQYSRWYRC